MPTDAVKNVLSLLKKVKQSGDSQWQALCPAHDDRRPSLSIGKGDDGRVLFKCHAGCNVKDILKVLGLKEKDLFPDLHQKTKRKITATYNYCDKDGTVLHQVVRFSDKTFMQRRPSTNGGWINSVEGVPRVLYRLPQLISADPDALIFVVEGEKDADSLSKIGLIATTNSGGAEKWNHLSDDSALYGRKIVIIPDKDEPGYRHAEDVCKRLFGKVEELRHLMLPGNGKDVTDWLNAGGRKAELLSLARSAPKWADTSNILTMETRGKNEESNYSIMQEYKSFPTENLPEPLCSYVLACAQSLNCDPAYIALPALAAVGSCIGNAARITLKRGWHEPPVLWTAVIGESGTMKSPAFKMAVNVIKSVQYKALTQYEVELKAYFNEMQKYEIQLAQAKRSKNAEDLPEKPDEPAAKRFWVSDVTSEAIAPILINNPKGVLCAVDELANWVRGFDRYVSGGKGADVARWLSMYDANSILIDRKTQGQRIISVSSAAVSLSGTIQPGVFFDCFKQKSLRESGLLARILIAMPPPKPALWTEAEIPEDIQTRYENVIGNLILWQPRVDENQAVDPTYIGVSKEAKERFIKFVNEHANETVELSGDLSAAWSKLKGIAARFALIFECIKTIAKDPFALPIDVKVGIESIESAIKLVNWFKLEAARIYEAFTETDNDEKFGSVIAAIKKNGGSVSSRDLMRIGPCYKLKSQAQRKLDEMAKEGIGYWRQRKPGGKGGAPKMEFALT